MIESTLDKFRKQIESCGGTHVQIHLYDAKELLKELDEGYARGFNDGCSKADANSEGEIADLKKAIREDIMGAGPCTGPIYHREIRKVIGCPPDGSGPEALATLDALQKERKDGR